MAKGRKASAIKKKLNMVLYGEQFTGKSTFASQIAMMHNEDGSPMKVLYIDCEFGSIDNYIEKMEAQGVNMNNIYILYTSSLAEVLEYIDKVKNHEPLPVLDDDGNEIDDEFVMDADGNIFYADAIVVDGTTILHMSVQQGLLKILEGAKSSVLTSSFNKKFCFKRSISIFVCALSKSWYSKFFLHFIT